MTPKKIYRPLLRCPRALWPNPGKIQPKRALVIFKFVELGGDGEGILIL